MTCYRLLISVSDSPVTGRRSPATSGLTERPPNTPSDAAPYTPAASSPQSYDTYSPPRADSGNTPIGIASQFGVNPVKNNRQLLGRIRKKHRAAGRLRNSLQGVLSRSVSSVLALHCANQNRVEQHLAAQRRPPRRLKICMARGLSAVRHQDDHAPPLAASLLQRLRAQHDRVVNRSSRAVGNLRHCFLQRLHSLRKGRPLRHRLIK